MPQMLGFATLDDEVSDAEEDASAMEALAAHNRGESASSAEVRIELGLN